MTHDALQLVIMMLSAAVLVVVVFRSFKLPPMLGYLLVGVLIGPHALGLISDNDGTASLAEFGVVFLMFTIGLEFSLPKLVSMRTLVFGLGGAQVVLTLLLVAALTVLMGESWKTGVALGGVLAMSSTAIVSKMLAERLELQSKHGRQIIGVLLFQDLAVVPLLILLPALTQSADALYSALGWALVKAAVVLTVLLWLGQKLMRPWFHLVARKKSAELFMLNVLLITLSLSYLTELAGLSLALGAFIAGMLISETEYRYQVEEDIKPFRDVLLGLFFITIGMMLNAGVVLQEFHWVVLLVLLLVVGKTVLLVGLGRLMGNDSALALRTGLGLAQAGEFGFVLLSLAGGQGLIPDGPLQVVLAAMVLSMLTAPFVLHYSSAIVSRLCKSEWAGKAKELHDIVVKSFGTSGHVLICGYGRSGQNFARILDYENVPFMALDLDPERVRAAAAAGESVVYGDAAKREVLIAAGLMRAKAVVVTYADVASAMRVLHQVQEIRPDLPVIVRTQDDGDIEKLLAAGATEVVPEILEGSLMLASHALMMMGVPLTRVLKRIRDVREQRYGLFKGFFRGASDNDADLDEDVQPRLQSVAITKGAYAIGKTLSELQLDMLQVEVVAVRRHNIRGLDPSSDTRIAESDVLVLRGVPEGLAAAEIRLLQG